jgi:hypothetical protein
VPFSTLSWGCCLQENSLTLKYLTHLWCIVACLSEHCYRGWLLPNYVYFILKTISIGFLWEIFGKFSDSVLVTQDMGWMAVLFIKVAFLVLVGHYALF